MSGREMRLGEILVNKGLISAAKLTLALDEQDRTREFLGAVLIRLGFIREEQLLKALSEQFELPFIQLKNEYIDWNVALRFSAALVADHRCIPYKRTAEGILLAIANPLDAAAISRAEKEAAPEPVKPVLATTADLADVIARWNEKNALRQKKTLE